MGRLSLVERNHNGFDLAQADLELRGPGDVFGLRQSGRPRLRASALLDGQLIITTKAEAEAEAEAVLDRDAALEQPEHAGLRTIAARAESGIIGEAHQAPGEEPQGRFGRSSVRVPPSAGRTGTRQSVALADERRSDGQAVGEQLPEVTVRELGRTEEVRDPDTVIEDVQGRKARFLRAGIEFCDAAALIDDEAEALDDLTSQTRGRVRSGPDTRYVATDSRIGGCPCAGGGRPGDHGRALKLGSPLYGNGFSNRPISHLPAGSGR